PAAATLSRQPPRFSFPDPGPAPLGATRERPEWEPVLGVLERRVALGARRPVLRRGPTARSFRLSWVGGSGGSSTSWQRAVPPRVVSAELRRVPRAEEREKARSGRRTPRQDRSAQLTRIYPSPQYPRPLSKLARVSAVAGSGPAAPIVVPSDGEGDERVCDGAGDEEACEITDLHAVPVPSSQRYLGAVPLQTCSGCGSGRMPQVLELSSGSDNEFILNAPPAGTCRAVAVARKRKRRRLSEFRREHCVRFPGGSPQHLIDLTADSEPSSDGSASDGEQTVNERESEGREEFDEPDFGALDVTKEIVKSLRGAFFYC
ncbi:MAG: hypothetical protein BJ554DRAFT_4552, partial [Olpidium bornovanus]